MVDDDRGRPRPTVSAAMIVRNEAAFLESCLRSIVSIVDQIIVVDTGSTDASADIAARFGAVVLHAQWTGDFSAARNIALNAATGDWILYIDADEQVDPQSTADVRADLARPDLVGGLVQFHPRPGFTPYREVRLFRNDPEIRFRSAIHETVHPDLSRVAAARGMAIDLVNLTIVHYGYEGDLTAKYRRNLPILQRAVRETPERAFLWVDMAAALAGLGRMEDALHACRSGIAAAKADAANAKQWSDGAAAHETLIRLLLPRDPDAAAHEAEIAVAAYPNHKALQLALANARYQCGQTNGILEIVEKLTAIDPDSFSDRFHAYDKRIFGEWAFDLMGMTLVRLRRWTEAAAAFDQAGRRAPGDLRYTTLRQMCRAKMGSQ